MATTATQARRGFFHAFVNGQRGATAVEFALVAAPFFFLLFAIVEVTVVFFVSTSMEHATQEVARTIRTGEAQKAGKSGNDFLQDVCNTMNDLVACNGSVYVDVRTFKDFGDVTATNPIKDNQLDTGSFEYDPGKAGDIVLVRVFYVWHLNTPIVSKYFANLSGDNRLITATVAFRNEPFGKL